MNPLFQQRHYEWVARLLRATKGDMFGAPTEHSQSYQQWMYIVGVFSSQFQLDNPRFDSKRFHDAIFGDAP